MTLVAELALWAAEPDATHPVELEQLIHAHFRFIWRLLRRLGLPESDADDAAQQVFLIAHTKLQQIAPGRERAFLYGCALRRAAKWREARARQSARGVSLDAPGESALVSSSGSPEELLDRAEARSLLDAVLEQLDEPQRTVFVLYEIEQLNSTEIAELLGVPRGTIASRLRRARAEFEQCVQRLEARRRSGRGGP